MLRIYVEAGVLVQLTTSQIVNNHLRDQSPAKGSSLLLLYSLSFRTILLYLKNYKEFYDATSGVVFSSL